MPEPLQQFELLFLLYHSEHFFAAADKREHVGPVVFWLQLPRVCSVPLCLAVESSEVGQFIEDHVVVRVDQDFGVPGNGQVENRLVLKQLI